METPLDFHRHFSWLRKVDLCSPASHETYQERLLRLEGDKESLVLQVGVLTDQVEAQGEKIRDLESSLEEHRKKLASTEELLQQELKSRTSLESQKLDLMDEVSSLRLQLLGVEETPAAATPPREDPEDAKQNKAEDLLQDVKQLKSRVDELEGEKGHDERRLRATEAEISELRHLVASKDAEIERLQSRLQARGSAANERDQEYQRLKAGMESLLASNEEKDRHIEELTILLGQYRNMREVLALTQGSSEEELSGSLRLRAITHRAKSDSVRSEMSSRGSSPLMLSSSPYQRELDSSVQNLMDSSLLSPGDTSSFIGFWPRCKMLSSSLEELQSGSFQKNGHMEPSQYRTLPGKLKGKKRAERNRQRDGENVSPVPSQDPDQDPDPDQDQDQDQDYSLRLPEKLDQSPRSSGLDSGQQSPVSPENRKTHRGMKKFWGKIRRSQSGNPAQVHDPELGEFRRGGLRSTAGPRLGNTRDLKLPFSKWSPEQVCWWLEDIGLGQYCVFAQHWVTGGDTLLSATLQDLEKELAMKNPLHRKKLQLAIKTLGNGQPEKSSELDYIWVTRWLDDIGLPQYKDQFNEGRVDGLMLQYLAVNDLLLLKVTSQLHHLSIKCAIHVLHVNKFSSNCLKRRPGHENQFTPSDVVQWSNHRVMEWLRSVDLAEYAPNLRGSGVHGGLLMLEPRFNWDTMALLLNIPPHKTLLRRHLNTNFIQLVGAQAHREKREYTEAPGYAPLGITAKVKLKKLGLSTLTHLRRGRSRRAEEESSDYVCPVEPPPPALNGVPVRPYAGFRGLSPILDREPAPPRADDNPPLLPR